MLCKFVNAQCVNGNVENGNFTNWSGATNTIATSGAVNFGTNVYGIVPGRHTIMTPGFDPIVGAPLNVVNQGNFSIRLGNSLTSGQTEMIKYTFLVTTANKNFAFRYAMVMQDPGHQPSALQPAFSYMLFKGANWTDWTVSTNTITSNTFAADSTNPFFSKAAGDVLWKNWTIECIDLTNYVGQTVSIIFSTKDCALGAHFGYAYIDGLCESNLANPLFNISTNVCLSNPIIADGTASNLENAHFWSVQEANSGWVATGPEYSQWFTGPAGIKDLKAFIESKGGQFKCNTYYRIKLGVSTTCNSWNSLVKLIYVRCPVVEDIPDIAFCCATTNTMVLGPKLTPNYSYNWAVNPLGYPYVINTTGNYATITNPNQSLTFSLTTTDQYGCSSTQDINLLAFGNYTVTVTAQRENCCSTKFVANIIFAGCAGEKISTAYYNAMLQKINFVWSNGATGPITYGTQRDSTLYTVTVTSPCATKTASGWHTGASFGSFTPLIAGNAFTPGSGSFNNTLIIYELGPNAPLAGQSPAYKATGYWLRIYNRWGGLVKEKKVDSWTGCLYQGEVNWDGKDESGNVVQDGVYVYKLMFKNCNNNWTNACNITTSTGGSVSATGLCKTEEWHWLPYGHYECVETWTESCIYSVTVLN